MTTEEKQPGLLESTVTPEATPETNSSEPKAEEKPPEEKPLKSAAIGNMCGYAV